MPSENTAITLPSEPTKEVLPDISILPLYTADCKIFLCTFFACIFDDAWKVNGKNTILDICYINQIKLHKQLTLHLQAKV